MRGEGGLPLALTEADLIERYHWTYDELDNADEDRVYTGAALQNMRDTIHRMKDWLSRSGKGSPVSRDDLDLYGLMIEAEKELNDGG